MKVRTGLLFVSSAALLSFTGCVDTDRDLFDAEATRELYENSFPVKDVDPNMDWKTTQNTSLSIAVEEDAGVNYRVRVFTADPLIEGNTAMLLAEGYAQKGKPFKSSFDCPTALDSVYVVRTDEHNRHVMRCEKLKDGALESVFGNKVATRADGSAENAKIAYSPEVTEAELLSKEYEELTESTIVRAGKVYRISAGNTVSNINTSDLYSLGDSGRATIIIAGTCTSTTGIQDNVDLYIVSGGKYIIPASGDLNVIGTSRMTVYAGGELSGGKFTYTNGYGKSYFAGTIDLGTFAYNGGDIYNYGTLTLDSLSATNQYFSNEYYTGGCRFINDGTTTIGGVHTNSTIINYCTLKCERYRGNLTLGESSKAYITKFSNENGNGDYGKSIVLGANSMIEVSGDANIGGTRFTGPSDGWALVKINRVTCWQPATWPSGPSEENIYFDINKTNVSLYSGNFTKPDNAPLVIPEGDCTGSGYTATDKGDDFEYTPFTTTYVFEDNYPNVGDYDFNDLVLDVASTYETNSDNTTNSVTLAVTLKAVGGIKMLGAGIRLVDIDKSNIGAITFSGDTDIRNTLTGSQLENATTESSDNDIVIPLFGDAHKALGLSERAIVNTGINNAATKTLNVKIEFTNKEKPVKLDNIDLFITNGGTFDQKRIEVHLYEFRDYLATSKGSICEQNRDEAGNYTWALRIPDFKYPHEYVNIKYAYPEFVTWAMDRTQCKNWYEHPTDKTDKTYIYGK